MEIIRASPSTFRIFFTSWFPQYWAARTPEPLTIPKTSRENTKNTLFASPTAAMEVSPKVPIIIVSTRFTMVFSIPCMATGKAIVTAFPKNLRSFSIFPVSVNICVIFLSVPLSFLFSYDIKITPFLKKALFSSYSVVSSRSCSPVPSPEVSVSLSSSGSLVTRTEAIILFSTFSTENRYPWY